MLSAVLQAPERIQAEHLCTVLLTIRVAWACQAPTSPLATQWRGGPVCREAQMDRARTCSPRRDRSRGCATVPPPVLALLGCGLRAVPGLALVQNKCSSLPHAQFAPEPAYRRRGDQTRAAPSHRLIVPTAALELPTLAETGVKSIDLPSCARADADGQQAGGSRRAGHKRETPVWGVEIKKRTSRRSKRRVSARRTAP